MHSDSQVIAVGFNNITSFMSYQIAPSWWMAVKDKWNIIEKWHNQLIMNKGCPVLMGGKTG